MQSTLFGMLKGSRVVFVVLFIAISKPEALKANEISAFRLTGVDGELFLRRTENEAIQNTESGDSNENQFTTNEEGFSFVTHSYVYHPKFMEMDLGAGVIFSQSEYETATGTSETDGELTSLTARMGFLKDKPYPFILHYNRVNPITQVSDTERLVSENERYGITASLLEPVIPFNINLEAFRESNKGEGATQVIDQTNEQFLLRAYRSLDNNDGHVQLSYHNRRQISESGLRNEVAQRTDRESESSSLDSDFRFGEAKQYRLINLFSYFTQDELPQQREFRWAPNLIWQHTDRIQSYYQLDYSDNEIDSVETTHRAGSMGVNADLTERVALKGQVRGSDSETVGLSSNSRGVNGSVSYTYPMAVGNLQLGYSTSYDLNENNASSTLARQQNERIKYDGVNRLQLTKPYVDTVLNVAVERNGVIIYPSVTVGEDYTVDSTDPVLTFINVVIKADPAQQKINPGDTLIVDYNYDTGGSVIFSTYTNRYSANLSLFRYYTIYASYSDTEHELEEGVSTIPLNSSKYTRFGVRMDQPFMDDKYRLGIESIYEKQDEEISPYIRRTLDTFVLIEISNDTKLRLSARRVNQDNQRSSTQDMDLRGRGVALSTRVMKGSYLRLETRDDEDVASETKRRARRKTIQFRMKVRKLTFSIDGSSVNEQYGGISREYNSITANLVRAF